MTALSTGDLKKALAALGSDAGRRRRMIALLLELEPSLAAPGFNVREEVTGPVVDALHEPGELIERTLSSGLVISFPYRSKIARDFVMAGPERPDHVWEPQTTRLLLALGRTAKVVIVGGAYFGDQAIPLADSMRAGGGVCHCFDMNAEQLAVLRRNAARNHLTNVVVNQLGLWATDDRNLVLEGDDSHAFAREVTGAAADGACRTVSIATYAAARKIDRIDLIMLDIEGAELSALRGAERFLSRPAPDAPNVIFEIHRSYVDWTGGLRNADIVAYLIGLGYQVFAIRDYQSNVEMPDPAIELIPADRAYLEGPPHGFNMIATKDPGLAASCGARIVNDVSPKLLFHRDPALHQPIG